MRNADRLNIWERILKRWALLPSVLFGDNNSENDWVKSTNRIMDILCRKVAEGRAYPDSIPSEALLEAFDKAINKNNDMLFKGLFYQDDHPLVMHVGMGIADAIRHERGELYVLRDELWEEAGRISKQLKDRRDDALAEGRDLIARETKKGSVEDEQQ